MTRKLPTLASLLLGAASAPAVVRALHPWSPVAWRQLLSTVRAREHSKNSGVGCGRQKRG